MKGIIQYITEKIKITKDNIDNIHKGEYRYFPKDNEELNSILLQKIEDSKNGTLDVSDINISNLEILSGIFSFDEMKYINNIIGLDSWDVSGISEINYLFSGCSKLKEIQGLENWDTSNIKEMVGVFFLCSDLTSLDLTDWDMSSVTSTKNMFACCYNLKTVGDISNWKIKNISDPYYLNRFKFMFDNCKKLKLDISNWKLPFNGRKYVVNSPHIKKY